jgi:DNA-binding response OmpR family regulator
MQSRGIVLIVEDNPNYAKITEKRLLKAGYSVVITTDGLNGYGMARKLHPDLILLDLMLPDLDGHKVCRLIKFDRNLRRIPIIIFTSRDTAFDRKIAALSRADAFLTKTTAPEKMMEVIQLQIAKTAAAGTENDRNPGRDREEPAFRAISMEAVSAPIAA